MLRKLTCLAEVDSYEFKTIGHGSVLKSSSLRKLSPILEILG